MEYKIVEREEEIIVPSNEEDLNKAKILTKKEKNRRRRLLKKEKNRRRRLLKKEKRQNRLKDAFKSAVKDGHPDIVEDILARGFQPDRLDLIYAVEEGTLDIIKAIAKRFDPREWDLCTAIQKGNLPIVKYFVEEWNMIPTERKSEDILKYASIYGSRPVLDYLKRYNAKHWLSNWSYNEIGLIFRDYGFDGAATIGHLIGLALAHLVLWLLDLVLWLRG